MAKNSKLNDIARSLNLLPYFQAHPGRTVFEAARDLGEDVSDIVNDLHRLHCTGPGEYPDELVDLQASYTEVQILNNQGLNRPLRLTAAEAAALLLTLEALESTPGLVDDPKAVVSAAAKLRKATGGESPVADVTPESYANGTAAAPEVFSRLKNALHKGTSVKFSYQSVNNEIPSQPQVAPLHIFRLDDILYLKAWNPTSDGGVGAIRTYRLDRMSDIEDVATITVPASARQFSPDDPFDWENSAQVAELKISRDSAWLADYHPLTIDGEADDADSLRAHLPVASVVWLQRFALFHADRIEVVGPPDLAAAVKEYALSASRAYDEDSTM
ncbi:helix-turn-helix transcriptional regulator [Corynebacterium renale]|uniref:Proteasome accessory factor C n=1 Tax=Corynebacterium renale TaxID=1724 RepID=A0A2A9DPW0_9CORY|nr:WYL domain-containing protein [Corynebacterium renale]PFG28728.1 proteasome accessory factor C [Corynebacterium renale]SQI26025.1 predicted transcriptional regulator [Corynebacterium renale]